MKKIEDYDAGKIGHLGVARNCAKTLLGMPNTKNETFEIETEIKFRVKSVPASKKSAGGVIEKTN